MVYALLTAFEVIEKKVTFSGPIHSSMHLAFNPQELTCIELIYIIKFTHGSALPRVAVCCHLSKLSWCFGVPIKLNGIGNNYHWYGELLYI